MLEHGFAELMREAQCGERMDREGEIHEGFFIAHDGAMDHVDLFKYSGGNSVLVYGQTELTRDLYEARDRMGGNVIHNAEDVTSTISIAMRPTSPIATATRSSASIATMSSAPTASTASAASRSRRTRCGNMSASIPSAGSACCRARKPVSPELIYAKHERGFALCSLRSQMLSRYYIQVPLTDRVEDWSDERSGPSSSAVCRPKSPGLVTGPSIEKSIAPLRSFVAEPMRHGRLFLAGDAAHIVPPTGARGLNSAASDIYYLYHALIDHYQSGDDSGLDGYSQKALARVWKAQRFSWWMTTLLHRFPDNIPYESRLQETELSIICSRPTAALRSLAENYVGLPF